MKKRKLSLNKESIKVLNDPQLEDVNGGRPPTYIWDSMMQTCTYCFECLTSLRSYCGC